MSQQFYVEEKKKNNSSEIIRIPSEMYTYIKELAEKNDRSITLQSQILLGAAINRGLDDPKDMLFEGASDERA